MYCSRCSAFQASKCSLYFSILHASLASLHPSLAAYATPIFPMPRVHSSSLNLSQTILYHSYNSNLIPSLSSHTKMQVLTAKSFSVSTLVTPLNSTFHLLLLLLSGGDVCVTLWLSESWGLPVNLSSYVCCVHMHVSV